MTQAAVVDTSFIESMASVATSLTKYVKPSEERRALVPGVLDDLAESGCLGRILPRSHGGLEEGLARFALQQEQLAYVWATAAVANTWSALSGTLISRFGTDRQRLEFLPGLASGTLTGAVGWTEPSGGSDAAAMETTARRADGGWILHGSKHLIDNAVNADFIIVGAVSDPEETPHRSLSMFLVRRDDLGFVPGESFNTLGLRPAGVGRFALEDCFVADDRLLGEQSRGFYQMMSMVELGRTGVAAICLGMTEAAIDAIAAFMPTRRGFGRRLSENDVVLATIADLRVQTDAARLLLERAAHAIDRGERCSREAAMAKLFASELAVRATGTALHMHGGLGFTDVFPIERHFRDSQAFTIGEGTSEVLRLVVGRTEFNQS